MNKLTVALSLTLTVTLMATGCKTSSTEKNQEKEVKASIKSPVRFNSDSAYAYVKRQVAFGPRVPGTEANLKCREYIVNELERHGAQNITTQTTEVTAYNGDRLPIANIMASYNPESSDRIILLAHYDTRPWADSDPQEDNRMLPVPGANDGASGVAVLLEMARQFNTITPPIGVDLLFVDAEDYGQASGFSTHDDSWGLGTQYWVANMPYASDSLPRYGILFDMVGGMNAKFHREYFSDEEAPKVVDKVWSVAERSGFGDRFINKSGGAVVDDHVFLNRAGIPTIDIIESKNSETRSFAPTWHTLNDNIQNIDPSSLKAAGQTVLNVIYNEIQCKK